jgi:hypothetical protein
MKRYFSDDSRNKAAMILASMSADMVNDIIELINTSGGGLTSLLFAEEAGPPRPLAMFSDSFIADADFPNVWVGFLTVQMAELRRAGKDAEQYAQILIDAYNIPNELAAPLAAKINTYDVIGGDYKNKGQESAWYKNMGAKISEMIRRVANVPSNLFNLNGFLYNDETSKYDVDYLAELSTLGEVACDLMARGRLMKGQALINANMGIMAVGDVEEGDVAEVAFNALKSLSRSPIPALLFGGAKKLAESGTKMNLDKARTLLAQAGILKDDSSIVRSSNPELKNAVLDILEGKPTVYSLFDKEPTSAEIQRFARRYSAPNDAERDAVYSIVADQWGDPAAKAWSEGDVYALCHAIMRKANTPTPTTGDVEADAAIQQDAHKQAMAQRTPLQSEVDKEVGFLFFGKKQSAADKIRESYLKQLNQNLQLKLLKNKALAQYNPVINAYSQMANVLPEGVAPSPQQIMNMPYNPNPAWPPMDPNIVYPGTNFGTVPSTMPLNMPSMGYTGLSGPMGTSLADFFPSVTDDYLPANLYPML